ncbi:phosphate acetyltransferase [Pseudodesulfovibrio senegalensis]|uniref:Phosphate acetyltransferase n=1 Tax=Pseudodesulfovibrio senegalensis TaxID=1721087 RepID=A0A6N6N6H1_9BACT|nr:phosphate acetyltransferase [Pseudodesulfovibrio senegalensis]KAB1443331.1 phosphate acetyltransferase [Pseudodesulfovibrio senegalensis]
MSTNLYITATEERSGKSAIVLGVMQLLLREVRKAAFFRPIINDPGDGHRDHDINLILSEYQLDIPYEDTYAYTLKEARELINSGQHALLLENILKKYKQLEAKYNFVLCEGTDFQGKDSAFEFDLNADIAANLGAPVMVVASGRKKASDEIVSLTQLTVDALEEKGLDVVAAVINRVSHEQDTQDIVSRIQSKAQCAELLVYAIAEDESLGNPSMGDVCRWLDGQILYGHGRMDTLVDNYIIAAMQIGNFLEYIDEGSLIITPGDRSDITLASLASRLSSSYPNIAGVVLTGGIEPSPTVHRLIEGWTGVPVPIVSVQGHTYQATQKLNELYGRIQPDDQKKIASALGLFESSVNVRELRERVVERKSTKITPKMFEYSLVEKAASDRQRIVLPEGTGERVLRATDILLRRAVADITLLGPVDEILNKANGLGLDLSAAQIIDPVQSEMFGDYKQTYMELRKKKGVTEDIAHDRMADPTYFGTMMVFKGAADGMVSGSVNTTAHTIRPAFEFIKTKPGASIVSSVFLMCLKDRVLVFGDCAVNPNPGAPQLAEIAISSAHTARIFGVEPRVAMLSYSTGSSGAGADVEKIIEATDLARKRAQECCPDLPIEGPLQYDAAIDPAVAATKLPGSDVAGRATVFVFPDLNAGNNTYKAVQRAAQAVAIGPVLQGLNKPVNDLSRGCTVPDIVNTVAITAIQAQAEKE